ncbi:glycine cleavage system H protein [bacterium BMS3Abin02]|nr:glycine cleavage system H protein [bacterium BMS3Abin02]GBE23721.1 glycine cleavage system H protein [bacterium BMS3Bbin01]HDH25947.1 glycine cleavage system protein GcvH [Actinomycetota bacterium]
MQVAEDRRYTQEHEWTLQEPDGKIRIGISDFAQDALGDVVYVELPEVGTAYAKGDSLCEVESTKSVSDVFAPVSGTVVAVNETLTDHPELINTDPYGEGWIALLDPTDAEETDALLDAVAYAELTAHA